MKYAGYVLKNNSMRFKYWLFSLAVGIIWVLECEGQQKIDLLAETNEIPYEKEKTKPSKSSNKPILVIKEPQFHTKTSTSDIRQQALPKIQEAATRKPLPHIVCPSKDVPKPLLSLPCFSISNCGFLGKDMLCCDGRCLKGVTPPKENAMLHHEPVFFGIIERKCPADPLTELSEVKECLTDDECSPRICCGEILPSGEKIRYCRTPIPIWDTLPLPSQVLEPLKTMTSYMQCTPPPPPHLDLYPKVCQNLMDCFPNLCCLEKGKKVCRPPKKSLLALVADLGQRIIPEDAAKKFIERIS